MKPAAKRKKIKVGLVGCGVIGSSLARFLEKEFSGKVRLSFLCDHHRERAAVLGRKLVRRLPILPLQELVQKSDLILEAASPAAAAEILRLAGNNPSKTILPMSVGGFLSGFSVPERIKTLRARILVPSGAVAGIDGLLAAREAGLKKVTLRTKKPPRGLRGAPYFQNHPFPKLRGTEERCVFHGTAAAAVRAFPQNINVAALLSLAGMGFAKTRVEIWTSRAYRHNRHEVEILHEGGRLHIEAENFPSPDNPKTSALAFEAARATLRRHFSAVKFGT